jgi:hypothetical protein
LAPADHPITLGFYGWGLADQILHYSQLAKYPGGKIMQLLELSIPHSDVSAMRIVKYCIHPPASSNVRIHIGNG